MAQRLTERSEIPATVSLDDKMHIVDVSDTSQNPEGSSYWTTVGNFLIDLGVGIGMASQPGYTVYKASGNTDGTALEVGDRIEGVGAYFSGDYIIATVATVPVIADSNLNTPTYRNEGS